MVGHTREEHLEGVAVEIPERNSTGDEIAGEICHVCLQLGKCLLAFIADITLQIVQLDL